MQKITEYSHLVCEPRSFISKHPLVLLPVCYCPVVLVRVPIIKACLSWPWPLEFPMSCLCVCQADLLLCPHEAIFAALFLSASGQIYLGRQ